MPRNSVRKAVVERADASLIAGNVKIHDRRTSVRLEPEMWSALHEIAKTEGITIHDVCTAVDDGKTDGESFSSSLRVFLLQYYREVARGIYRPVKASTERKQERDKWPVLRSARELRSKREA